LIAPPAPIGDMTITITSSAIGERSSARKSRPTQRTLWAMVS